MQGGLHFSGPSAYGGPNLSQFDFPSNTSNNNNLWDNSVQNNNNNSMPNMNIGMIPVTQR